MKMKRTRLIALVLLAACAAAVRAASAQTAGERLEVAANFNMLRLSDFSSTTVILMLLAPYTYQTEFAFDLGGGLEAYPTDRTVARVEVGDTMIRHRSAAPRCPSSPCTSHNLSSRLGIGYRF